MAQNDKVKGVWLITTADGLIIPENSELAALRTAVSTAGKLEFVKYGEAAGTSSKKSFTIEAEGTPDF